MNRQEEARRLVVTYERAAESLAGMLRGIDPATFTDLVAAEVRERVDQLIARLDRSVRAWARRVLPAAYRAERRVSETRLSIVGRRKGGRLPAGRHERTMKDLVEKTLRDLWRANATFRDTADRFLVLIGQSHQGLQKLRAMTPDDEAAIEKMATEAVKEGLSQYDLKKQIQDFLASKIKGGDFIALVGKDGVLRHYRAGKYADLVANVQMREAASKATINSALDYDHDLVEIPQQGGACDDCKEVQGKVYSISGRTPGYPLLTEEVRPPLHPLCRHYLRVVSETTLTFRKPWEALP